MCVTPTHLEAKHNALLINALTGVTFSQLCVAFF